MAFTIGCIYMRHTKNHQSISNKKPKTKWITLNALGFYTVIHDLSVIVQPHTSIIINLPEGHNFYKGLPVPLQIRCLQH